MEWEIGGLCDIVRYYRRRDVAIWVVDNRYVEEAIDVASSSRGCGREGPYLVLLFVCV